jgi:signal transduction histidine kinase
MRLKPVTLFLILLWCLFLGAYALCGMVVPPGPKLTLIGNVLQCVAPLLANAGLLLNAGSPHWRRNAFWMLLALGCTMWMGGQLLWTYYEVVIEKPVPNPFAGDVVFFLHTVPMIAALALVPDARRSARSLRFGYLDFLLLVTWWLYLYAVVVLPWQYVQPDVSLYGHSYNQLYTLENAMFLAVLIGMWWRARGAWRTIYAHLFFAGALYMLAALIINVAIDLGKYHTGSRYDLPLVASFLWFGTAGLLAWRLKPEAAPAAVEAPARDARTTDNVLVSRLAMTALLSLPLLAAWELSLSTAAWPVRQFRLVVTLIAIVVMTALVFLRQHLVDQERMRLLRASHESLHNLKRLQTSFAQSERMASLGQLAAGAAHEINNPLTAILGYADLLLSDRTLQERHRGLAAKIQEQARRTKTLVTSLLSFARQVPAVKTFLDIQAVVRGAVQLRTLDLRDKNIRIQIESESVLPGVRGDPNQLLQVFYNLISNAVDAMESQRSGLLSVRAFRERSSVVIEFSDTGCGLKEPDRVFDPFYTTKPVGKGTGLGLSFCYGIIQEHGGKISAFNRPEGGATFRIELPAVNATMPANPALAAAHSVARHAVEALASSRGAAPAAQGAAASSAGRAEAAAESAGHSPAEKAEAAQAAATGPGDAQQDASSAASGAESGKPEPGAAPEKPLALPLPFRLR